MKLVFAKNNRPVTDSVTVAETFGKEHKRVMQDVRELECSDEFRQHHFVLSSYTSSQNKELPMYLITEQGFSFLVMGYTGKEAARFKEMYINEFNRMRDDLTKSITSPSYMLDDPIARASKWIEEMKHTQMLEQQNAHKDEMLKLQEPKVALYDVAMAADGVQPVGTVAKELGLGRTRLFAILRDKKVLRQNNEPYQEFIERGYFKLRMYTITHKTSGLENKTQPMVTAKGVAWLHKMLKEA